MEHKNIFEQPLPWGPWAVTILCGEVSTNLAKWVMPDTEIRCYSALMPGMTPALGLPYVYLDVPASPEKLAATLPAEIEATLAELLQGMDWLFLVHDATPASMAVASAIGRYARQRDIEVAALQTRPLAIHADQQQILRDATCFSGICTPDLDLLVAVQVLFSSVMHPGVIGVDFGDLRCSLAGPGQVVWAPLPDDDIRRLPDMLASLPPFHARTGLWAAFVAPETCGLDDFTQVGDFVNQHCSEEATVVIGVPETDVLPNGLYLFIC